LALVREQRDRQARANLQRKQKEIADLEAEIARLEKRRAAVIRRGGSQVLRERLVLDALTRITLERRATAVAVRREVARLLEDYLTARAQLDAVRNVRRERREERESVLERHAEQVGCDSASARRVRDAVAPVEEPCED
jgi:hypothetical protein